MQTGMNIGTVVNPESLNPLADAIIRILEADCDQKTKRHAITALQHMARIENVTIQNCVVKGDRILNVDMDDAQVHEQS